MKPASRMTIARLIPVIFVVIALTGCASGENSLLSASTTAATAEVTMPGRWMLSAPNAPSCGMNFAGGPGAYEGTVVPDGGCPGRFFTSRRWVLASGGLTINDHEGNALAQLGFAGGNFEGKTAEGMPVTLAR